MIFEKPNKRRGTLDPMVGFLPVTKVRELTLQMVVARGYIRHHYSNGSSALNPVVLGHSKHHRMSIHNLKLFF